MTLILVFAAGLVVLLVLAILALVLSQNTTRLNRTDTAWDSTATPELSPSEKERLLGLIRQGQHIQAIKEYKLLTGCSLKVAKERVAQLRFEA